MQTFLAATLGLATPQPSIEWSAPPGCPERSQVVELAGSLIDGPALEVALREVGIRGAITAAPPGFVLDIDIRTPSGVTRKTAQADDCEVLGRWHPVGGAAGDHGAPLCRRRAAGARRVCQ